MDAFQGHASLAYPAGILATWAIMMTGGIQVNKEGKRFGDETKDYSGYALRVMEQPEGLAYDIFGERTYQALLEGFEEFRHLVDVGAVRVGESAQDLGRSVGIDPTNLAQTIDSYNAASAD